MAWLLPAAGGNAELAKGRMRKAADAISEPVGIGAVEAIVSDGYRGPSKGATSGAEVRLLVHAYCSHGDLVAAPFAER